MDKNMDVVKMIMSMLNSQKQPTYGTGENKTSLYEMPYQFSGGGEDEWFPNLMGAGQGITKFGPNILMELIRRGKINLGGVEYELKPVRYRDLPRTTGEKR